MAVKLQHVAADWKLNTQQQNCAFIGTEITGCEQKLGQHMVITVSSV